MLQTAFGSAERKALEAALVNYGINMGAARLEIDGLTPGEIDRVVQDHPLLGCQEKLATSSWIMPTGRPDCRLCHPGRVGGLS